MEQLLTVFGIDWRMLLAETFNFLILLAGLSYFLYKPVMKMLAERSQKTAQGIRDADAAAIAVKDIEDKRAGMLSAAERESEALVERAQLEGKDERAKIIKTAQDRSDAMLEDAKKEAMEMQRRALLDTEKEVTRLAVLAAERILRKQS